ncbi:MAG TPA: aminotransferase class I/II-fold pyridoxal phosphate-dependent enzyme [Chloroflexota bacterium]|nr:aminotransferase class I/II-fold pyridoxal phosphate-dependent enzyme [Chloroflexota bacterium]
MSEQRSDWAPETRLLHGGRPAHEGAPVAPPIFQTSTFQVRTPEEAADMAVEVAPAMYYGRLATPNTKQVEAMLADLEGGEAALAVGSGMAAVTIALMAHLRAGDHVVAQVTHYTATLTQLTATLPRYGIEVTQVDQTDVEAFARAMRPNTRVVYTESPTNPTIDLTDLRATAEIAHAGGALAITDNTFASSYNQRPLDLGYDVVLHSATKYLNGHSDVTAGVIVSTRQRVAAMWDYLRQYGPVLHPFDAWLLQRGLRTYTLRMERHNHNALSVARFLESHPAVARVHYPGLASHPQHDLARRQMTGGFGGMIAFEVKGGYEAAYRLVSRTELCILAVSLGSVETLIAHPASMVHSFQSAGERDAAGIAPGLIRLSVGIERAEDIIADLDRALA